MTETIEKAYSLFSKYKVVRPLDICTAGCCMTIEEEGLLATLPVREIPKELLSIYNDGASTAKTPIDELKHFLPRYIELISNFDFPTHSAEIAFRRLAPFNISEWTNEELNFLDVFSLQYFKKCLTIYPLPENEAIDTILIMFWRGQFNINTLLSYWQSDYSLESTLHFKDLHFRAFNDFTTKRKLTNSFGEKDIAENLKNWMITEETKQNFRLGVENAIVSNEVTAEPSHFEELNLLYEMLTTQENAT